MSRSLRWVLVLLVLSQLLSGAVWYKENLAYGLRDAILLFLSFSPNDPDSMYLATTDGYVFSTHNQGQGWDEARIIVKGKSFFGAIRPERAPNGVAMSAATALEGAQSQGIGKTSLIDLFYFDYGEVEGELDVLESGLTLRAYDPVRLPAFPQPGNMKIRDRSGGGRGGGGNARLGVGLKTGAPRLKAALRSMKAPSVGANLQQLLVEMGVEPTWINHIAVHNTDPNTAIAATSMGTYRTTDGGVGWLPIFAGTNRWERDGQHVRYDPLDPERIYLGTQNGLFISENGGERWERVSGTMLESAYVTWIEPVVVGDTVWLYVGSSIGGFLSTDQGRNWRWIFYETLPDANWIASIAVDAGDPKHTVFSTWDGIFVTFDAGANWERTGGLMFTNIYVPRVLIDPQDGAHAFACTEKNVWETRDHGRTWQVIYIDNGDWKLRNMELDPHEPGVLWIVTSGQILRLRSYRQAVGKETRVEMFREVMADEPGETEVLDRVFKNLGIHPGQRMAYRRRAALSALVPELRAVGGYFSTDASAFMDLYPLTESKQLAYNHVLVAEGGYVASYVAVMAVWDLAELPFTFDELATGRVFGEALGNMYGAKFEVARYYNERIRLIYKLIMAPPEDTMAYFDAALRYRELTEHLNALTGGLYDEKLKQIEEGGLSWLRGL